MTWFRGDVRSRHINKQRPGAILVSTFSFIPGAAGTNFRVGLLGHPMAAVPLLVDPNFWTEGIPDVRAHRMGGNETFAFLKSK
jgi:hypothetical protein